MREQFLSCKLYILTDFREFFCVYLYGVPRFFHTFVLGEHTDYCLYHFMFEHYKGTTIIANHQIFRQLNFVELTLT